MRKDLITASSYQVGIKFTNEKHYRLQEFSSLEEALKKFNEYKEQGYDPIIRGVK